MELGLHQSLPQGIIHRYVESVLSSSTVIEEDPSKDGPQVELCSNKKTCVSLPVLPTDRKCFPNGERPKVPKEYLTYGRSSLEGEISMEDLTPPKRTVHMTCVTMTHNTKNKLLYSHQEMSDSAIRLRNRPDRNGRWPKTAWEAVEIARALG